jgi:hypothetical protein
MREKMCLDGDWTKMGSSKYAQCTMPWLLKVFGILDSFGNLNCRLKLKYLLWYLNKCSTLTKDNLVWSNWIGSTSCAFCNNKEIIQHLFFECHYAKFLWRALHVAFGIQSPTSINYMFTSWLLALGRKRRKQILVGATASILINPLWKCICRSCSAQHIGAIIGRCFNRVRRTPMRWKTHAEH